MFRFPDVPLEIRNQIYRYLQVNQHITKRTSIPELFRFVNPSGVRDKWALTWTRTVLGKGIVLKRLYEKFQYATVILQVNLQINLEERGGSMRTSRLILASTRLDLQRTGASPIKAHRRVLFTVSSKPRLYIIPQQTLNRELFGQH